MATDVKEERIDFRTTDRVKRVIQQAADLLGTTMSAFVAQHSYDAARQVLAQHENLELSNQDRDLFVSLLDNPPKPNTALGALLKGE